MSAILISSGHLAFVASFAILRTKRASSKDDASELPPGVSPRSLSGAPAVAEPQREHAELAAQVAAARDLRASPEPAEMPPGVWRARPTPASTAELLRVSALSDDAGTFGRAVTEVLRLWEEAALAGFDAEDLRALCEAEYWLLSSEARRSGAGFVLKQKLTDVRRRLAAGARQDIQVGPGGHVARGERRARQRLEGRGEVRAV